MKKIIILVGFLGIFFNITPVFAGVEKAIFAKPCGGENEWCLVLQGAEQKEVADYNIRTDENGKILATVESEFLVKKLKIKIATVLNEWNLTPSEVVLKVYNDFDGKTGVIAEKPVKIVFGGLKEVRIKTSLSASKIQGVLVLEKRVITESSWIGVLIVILVLMIFESMFGGIHSRIEESLFGLITAATLIALAVVCASLHFTYTSLSIAVNTTIIVISFAVGLLFSAHVKKIFFIFFTLFIILELLTIFFFAGVTALGIFFCAVVGSFLLGRYVLARFHNQAKKLNI